MRPASPASPMHERDTIEIGIIGLGDMGKMYARTFVRAGWKNVNVCDLPERYEHIRDEFKGSGCAILKDGHAVSRRSDFIIYSVEAAAVDRVVAQFGPSTKMGAVVAGQTSVKDPEIKAFERHLPSDVHIVSCHSLHGPAVNPKGQPLVLIRHRSDEAHFHLVKRVLAALESEFVYLSYLEHDKITADTQAVTHLAFLSMGTAWKAMGAYPWENASGIENVKILMALRIYGNKWHVYAGLAILNPSAQRQVRQYAQSVSLLFRLMIQEKKEEFTDRVKKAVAYVFGPAGAPKREILLNEQTLDQFSLGSLTPTRIRNSHLSLLAMVDCWYTLNLNPYHHLICQTPPFRLLLGITEYVVTDPDLLSQVIETALYDKRIRGDDMEFYSAARGWAECIAVGSFDTYRHRFEETATFFGDRLKEAGAVSSRLIATVAANANANANAIAKS
ncbi:hypothetical protein SeMB42_g06712 [Synchytrium endobioticum]|uniref:Prephenate dehydrogenase [NADP(+)] n=1 Tax=Synchytrium endobioticum TaxID=286115 RepID=A0A507CIE4_9FUNG|nr:hypothetical protein SeMB42_g06712 [Synchytrium endobioticum]TPX39298.1 hypothetical protein SeLEV6574_g07318 [Synchytrium endobioticum]